MKAYRAIKILYFVVGFVVLAPLIYILLTRTDKDVFNLQFNLFGFLSLSGAIADVVIIYLVNRSKVKSDVSFWFSICLSIMIFWGVSEAFQRFSVTSNGGMFWFSIQPLGWLFLPIAFFLLCLSYTKNDFFIKNFLHLLILFSPAVIMLYLMNRTGILVDYNPATARFMPWGWDNSVTTYFGIFFIWFETIFLVSIALLIIHYKQSVDADEKRQIIWFIIGTTIPLVGGTLTDILLPTITNQPIIPTVCILTTIMGVTFAYAIFKYKLFTFNPAKLSSYILEAMSEGLIILSHDFKIEYANKRASELLRNDHDKLIGTKMTQYFPDIAEAEEFHKNVIMGLDSQKVIQAKEGRICTPDGKVIPVSYSSTRVMPDQQLSTPNFIIAISDISELKQYYYVLEEKVKERTKELEDLKTNLEQTVEERTSQVKEKLIELETLNSELAALNKTMIGRETKMIELKEENQILLSKLNIPLPKTENG